MDFSFGKPGHWFAALFISITLLLFTLLPIVSLFGIGTSPQVTSPDIFPFENQSISFELFLLLIELIMAFVLLVLAPFFWYAVVNELHLKDILSRLQLKKTHLPLAFLWAIVAVIASFAVIFVIDLVIIALGYDLTDASNIITLESLFSLPSIIILLLVQPIAEEIYFRGFLLEKLTKLSTPWIALVVTSALFGIAHLTYNNIYPAFMTFLAGIILGYAVIKTKNLTTGIIAHIIFNATSFSLYLLGQYLGI